MANKENSPPADPLSEASTRLIEIARDAAREGTPVLAQGDAPSLLSDFVQTYREWIILERGALGTQPEQALHWQMLVHCMISGATIEEAIGLLIRFSPIVWAERAPQELRNEGEVTALVLREPFHPGTPGLVTAIWMLSLLLSTLEFLANGHLTGSYGRVLHEPSLTDGVQHLLFDAPLRYSQDELSLVIPNRHLRRPIVARSANLPGFFRQLLPLTLGAQRDRGGMRAMVAGLIRDDKQGEAWTATNRANVAARFGISEATLRRRLRDEGTNFRAIKEAVHDELAKEWLLAGEFSVDRIAERLGFSDSFAFRRAFQRRNGCAPTAYRKRLGGGAGVGGGLLPTPA